MSRLLAARDEQGRGLSATELADQVAVLMLAGGETTSAAVAWSWHLLCGHPEILAAVQAETDAILGRDVAGWDHLPRLDLTARVVREALRLYPPGWVIPRICTRPVTLAGRTLPAGSIVVFSPYVLHRRPDLYPEPHRFDPGRWLTPAPAQKASYLPFGAGATRCIGEEFGLAEATLILASMAARWDLTPEGRPHGHPGGPGRPGPQGVPGPPDGPPGDLTAPHRVALARMATVGRATVCSSTAYPAIRRSNSALMRATVAASWRPITTPLEPTPAR